MYKMVALDIDGTCVDTQGRVRPRVREAVARAQEAGVKVTLATGRRLRQALPVARSLGIDLPLIVQNGAMVYDQERAENWYVHPLPLDAALRAVRYLRSHRLPVVVFTDEAHGPDVYYEGAPASPSVQAILQRYGNHARSTNDLQNELCGQPLKVFTFDWAQRVAPAASALSSRVPGPYNWLAIPNDLPGHLYLEMWAAGSNKWTAVDRVARYLGIHPHEIIAIGDNLNDLEMIQQAGLGVAMGNGHPQVRAVADVITATNEEDGVAEVMERYLRLAA